MSARRVYTAEFRGGLTARLCVSLEGMEVQWIPDLPSKVRGINTRNLLEAYRSWRDECLADFAREYGLTIRRIHTPAGDVISFYQ